MVQSVPEGYRNGALQSHQKEKEVAKVGLALGKVKKRAAGKKKMSLDTMQLHRQAPNIWRNMEALAMNWGNEKKNKLKSERVTQKKMGNAAGAGYLGSSKARTRERKKAGGGKFRKGES